MLKHILMADVTINAEIVQAHACSNQLGSAIKANGKRPPEYPKPPDQNPKCTLNWHAIGALLKVICVQCRITTRGSQKAI
mmetsp:Transcript_52723/g.115009  ORF Transcript_52723/g.115009 Transcript_52723/m.115009 type:complete len:80 (+) Transcript_52723:389-628(+)